MNKITEMLIEKGLELLDEPYKFNEFTHNRSSDILPNDLHNYPHAFVLACIMDRKMPSERAQMIPYKISQEIGGFDFKILSTLSLDEIKNIFSNNTIHRFV